MSQVNGRPAGNNETEGFRNDTAHAEAQPDVPHFVLKLKPKSKDLDRYGSVETTTVWEGLPWMLTMSKSDDELKAKIIVDNPSPLWQAKAKGSIVLRCSDDKDVVIPFEGTFAAGKGVEMPVIDWQTLVDAGNGYRENGKLSVEAAIHVKSTAGLRESVRFDFTKPHRLFDVILLVEGKKIYAGKQVLASASPFFDSLFYGDFAEKDKEQIELKDVEYEDCLKLFALIYHSDVNISTASVEQIIKLSDRFGLAALVARAERLLISNEKYAVCHKLLIADQYMLARLEGHCLKTIDTRKKVKELAETEEFEKLSYQLQSCILKKLLVLRDDESGSGSSESDE